MRQTEYKWGDVFGAVAPHARRQGIATAMTRRQHARCAEAGYERIRTHTTNARRPMLLLNIKEVFDVIGMSYSGELKIVLEKSLMGQSAS